MPGFFKRTKKRLFEFISAAIKASECVGPAFSILSSLSPSDSTVFRSPLDTMEIISCSLKIWYLVLSAPRWCHFHRIVWISGLCCKLISFLLVFVIICNFSTSTFFFQVTIYCRFFASQPSFPLFNLFIDSSLVCGPTTSHCLIQHPAISDS